MSRRPVLTILSILMILTVASFSVQAATQLSVMLNAERGGKNTQDVEWLDQILPKFEQQMAAEGQDVKVEVITSALSDEDYKARLALDIQGKRGADVIAFDSFWVPEFAEAHMLLPLDQYVAQWPDWSQFYDSMKTMGAFGGHQYLLMSGTDVRMLYYNKTLFRKAGLPVPWRPKNWDDIFAAAKALAKLPGVTPLQINAGTDMGEATTMQGALMVLISDGGSIFDWKTNKWIVKSPQLLDMLNFYKTVYVDKKWGDAQLQLSPKSRDKSFQLFQAGKIAVLAEGTWFWNSVISPNGAWAISNRDEVIGWAPFPGSGKAGAPPVASISGGTGFVINPSTKHAKLAWELLAFLSSKDSMLAHYKLKPTIPSRKDVAASPLVQADKFTAETAAALVPYTQYRPGFPVYPQISYQIQLATERVVSGQMTPKEALDAYAKAVAGLVGADKVEIK